MVHAARPRSNPGRGWPVYSNASPTEVPNPVGVTCSPSGGMGTYDLLTGHLYGVPSQSDGQGGCYKQSHPYGVYASSRKPISYSCAKDVGNAKPLRGLSVAPPDTHLRFNFNLRCVSGETTVTVT